MLILSARIPIRKPWSRVLILEGANLKNHHKKKNKEE